MRKVGADDNQRSLIAPKQPKNFGNLFGGGLANCKRHQRESGKCLLQEGKVHLQRMFMFVRVVADANLRQMPDRRDRFTVQRNFAERRGKGIGRGQSQSVYVDTVGRAEQHDAGIVAAKRRQKRVSVRRHRTRIDITGVRCNERLGSLLPGRRRGGQQRRNLRLQCDRGAR